jgi:hypothetical protein
VGVVVCDMAKNPSFVHRKPVSSLIRTVSRDRFPSLRWVKPEGANELRTLLSEIRLGSKSISLHDGNGRDSSFEVYDHGGSVVISSAMSWLFSMKVTELRRAIFIYCKYEPMVILLTNGMFLFYGTYPRCLCVWIHPMKTLGHGMFLT